MDDTKEPVLLRCSDAAHEGERLLPPDAFWRRRDSRSGRQPRCIACGRREYRERYHRNPEKFRACNKRYRFHTDKEPHPEALERYRQRKAKTRLEVRRERARLLMQLVADDYGLGGGVSDLQGPCTGPQAQLRREAQMVAVRLITQFTYLPFEEIGAMLDCTPRTVRQSLERARRLTRWGSGDIRLALRLRRLRAAYRKHVPPQRPAKGGAGKNTKP